MKLRSATAAASIAALVLLAGCSSSDDDAATAETTTAMTTPSATPSASETEAMSVGTIVDVAAGNADFETLVAAVTAAGLVETLSGTGPFTVFAPTDEAFEALPDGVLDALLEPENKDALTSILTYHVVPGKVTSDLVTAGEVATVEGSTVELATEGGVTVDGANVVTPDVMASNGVIHVIDAVIVPDSVDVAALTS